MFIMVKSTILLGLNEVVKQILTRVHGYSNTFLKFVVKKKAERAVHSAFLFL